jgi:hypothetical protein
MSIAATNMRISSSPTCETNLKDLPVYLVGGMTSPKFKNFPYFVDLHSSLTRVLFMLETLSCKNKPLAIMTKNLKGFHGRRMIESRFFYETAASLLFVTAAFGMTMNIQLNISNNSTGSKNQGEESCGDGQGGRGPSHDKNDVEGTTFGEQTKQDVRLNPLKKPYDVR